MPLRNLLKRRDGPATPPAAAPPAAAPATNPPPQFTFIRTTTDTQEQIFPPQYAGDAERVAQGLFRRPASPREQLRHSQHQQHQQHMQQQHQQQQAGAGVAGGGDGAHEQQQQQQQQRSSPRTLTERLQAARRSRSRSVSRPSTPTSTAVHGRAAKGGGPEESAATDGNEDQPRAAARGEDERAAWERRATQLAHGGVAGGGGGSRPVTPVGGGPRAVSDAASDVGLDLEQTTGRRADYCVVGPDSGGHSIA
jgi:hypothetical protein